ncbi:MAG: PHP domain-containing protein, partial [Staphylococcus equorum]|nr:PHP domain-containing protein [Staphylococcus equorum]
MTDLNALTYQNIHSHSFYSNISTHDSVISRTDVAERAVELGHTTLSCIEHGYMGNVFETYRIAKQFNLKLIFGTEFYYVKDRFEKDRTNSHLLVVAKNENGKEAITGLISESYQTGFYGRNRIDEELLFSLPKDDVIVTTACIASPINLYEGYAEYFIPKAKAYFGDNFFLEVQPHWNKKQADFNEKLIEYRKEYNVPFILGVDTHYIKEEDYKMRDIYLKSRKIVYDKEEGFFMDYPETKTIIERFNKQAVLSDEQITEAFNNSHIVDKFDAIEITDDIKMPSVYPDKTEKEKVNILKQHINKAWVEDRKHIPKERHKEYIEAIKSEMSIVENTHMVDYFLMNEKIITLGKEKYGGVLTMTGRGS